MNFLEHLKNIPSAKFDPYQEFIYYRTYSRWLPEEGRRETWAETVARYAQFMWERVPKNHWLQDEFLQAIRAVYQHDIMPSMRALWSAGPALEKENVTAYNCSYLPINSIRAMPEMLYILMCGTGVGFSVETAEVNKLPVVPPDLSEINEVITVHDSRRGWAGAFYTLLSYLWQGLIPKIDYSKIRPKGARLVTFGGRASGPEPLQNLFNFTIETFRGAAGRRLKPIEIFDICVTIANCVIVGGVRRSATICLSDLNDEEMRHAKYGEWWKTAPNRSYANISAVYTDLPSPKEFLAEWTALANSGSGERGIFNRKAAKEAAKAIRRDDSPEFGTNPCGEIILRPYEFCNLTEVVVRPWDNIRSLQQKVRLATVLGCLQATLTDFDFLRSDWKNNCVEERLLGVSLTGLFDNVSLLAVMNPHNLWFLRRAAQQTAFEWAKALGINRPAAITCVKPSGTVSQLVNCASGLHPQYAKHYIRRVRVASHDPLAAMLLAQGVPCHPEVGETWETARTLVFEFPRKAYPTSRTREEIGPFVQLRVWQKLKKHWTDHNPSCTIYVPEKDWIGVGNWVWENFDSIGGLSFLPYDGGTYELSPYQEISEKEYERLTAEFPKIDFSQLSKYESEDNTTGSQELACVSGACEI